MKRVKVYYGMVDKDKMELMNLRKRVKDQRGEIKRLTAEITRLKEMLSGGYEEISPELHKQLGEWSQNHS